MMENRKIRFRIAGSEDAPAISALFIEHLRNNPEYISHGEMQMGIALDRETVSSQAGEKWLGYITERIGDRAGSVIVVTADGGTVGFVVLQQSSDGGKPFGVVNDILVAERHRGQGIGKSLLEKGLEWFRGRGIGDCYLESGRHNHFAHEFFSRQGFALTSFTFHMNINRRSEFEFPDAENR